MDYDSQTLYMSHEQELLEEVAHTHPRGGPNCHYESRTMSYELYI